jgi:hypothetical protein
MADPTIVEAAASALSVKSEGSTGVVDQYGPALIALATAVFAVCSIFGIVVPANTIAAVTSLAGLVGGFLVRHRA